MTETRTLTDSPNNVKRVLLVDDHPMMRDGIALLISSQDDLEVCGEAGDIPSAFGKIISTKPDLVILDLSLGTESSMSYFDRMRELVPGLPILIVSMHDEMTHGYRAIQEGADGYVQKSAGSGEILAAARTVLNGGQAISPRLIPLFVRASKGKGQGEKEMGLSRREFEVYQLIGVGLATRQISAKLGVSPRTVEAHKENIKKKLEVKTAAELAKHAAQFMQGSPPIRG